MNYFAHGLPHLHRPYFLAGTAVPDWLSVVDRRVRMRARRVRPVAVGDGSPEAEIAAGVLQHLQDDDWFHSSRAFLETSGQVSRLFRSVLGPEDGFRPSFLGHIATELVLDGLLIEANPGAVDAYYDAIRSVDFLHVQTTVNRMARRPCSGLDRFIDTFCHVQFLRDYTDSARLLVRLNQVMRRIKLKQLPAAIERVLEQGRSIVRERMGELRPLSDSETPTESDGESQLS